MDDLIEKLLSNSEDQSPHFKVLSYDEIAILCSKRTKIGF